ncbi:hypothetical protein PAHAL_9G336300 [Panicum hallii]|jgi:hypothetical protein|uniref:Uncharacterized protein n=1 Tax=Panicum hallii TaxID=206008 RepID=A0A2S3IMT7_9POAL|nr:hypothetical protein PAHAL_9G336300 [Panicum hallii]
MYFRGFLDLNSASIGALTVPDADLVSLSLFEEQDFLAAPSVLESQQVLNPTLPSVHSVSDGAASALFDRAPYGTATEDSLHEEAVQCVST